MKTHLEDARGNRANIAAFGSEEAAQKALDSLTGCDNCTDCSRCTDCSDCTRCNYCDDCTRCTGCTGCDNCTDFTRCTDCSDCTGCDNCTGCTRCDDCSDCSGCYGCSGCYDCSDCVKQGEDKMPEIPVVSGIHRAVYAAATATPDAFDMDHWHTCETTHCRAGWVVHLAGEKGKLLEEKTSTLFAAMMIYRASGAKISPCRFFGSADKALADMRRLAEAETEAAQDLPGEQAVS